MSETLFTEDTIDGLRRMVADMLAKEPDGPAWNVMRILLVRGDAWREIALATAPRCFECRELATGFYSSLYDEDKSDTDGIVDVCDGHYDRAAKDLPHAAAVRAVVGKESQ